MLGGQNPTYNPIIRKLRNKMGYTTAWLKKELLVDFLVLNSKKLYSSLYKEH
jgi:hypothetical protein